MVGKPVGGSFGVQRAVWFHYERVHAGESGDSQVLGDDGGDGSCSGIGGLVATDNKFRVSDVAEGVGEYPPGLDCV